VRSGVVAPAVGFASRSSGGRTRGSQLGSVAGNREAGPRPWGVSPPSRAARLSSNGSRRSACWRESDGQKTPRRVLGRAPTIGLPGLAFTERPPPPWHFSRGSKRGAGSSSTRSENRSRERESVCPVTKARVHTHCHPRQARREPGLGRGPSRRRRFFSREGGVYWMPAAAGMTAEGGWRRGRVAPNAMEIPHPQRYLGPHDLPPAL
jgi:hypothetical protein